MSDTNGRSVRQVAAGSAMFTRRLSMETDPRFHSLVSEIREADASIVNLEGPMYTPGAYPVKQYIFSTYFTTGAWLADELRWAGFTTVGLANNHMSDYSPESVRHNRDLLERSGLTVCGAGMSLTEARMPAYVDTPNGRIAFLAVDSSFEFGEFVRVQMASDPRGPIPGRPGVNGLPYETTHIVDEARARQLQETQREIGRANHGLEVARYPPFLGPVGDEFLFLGQRFKIGEPARTETTCAPRHLEAILRWIANAASQADAVVVFHHRHISEGSLLELPPDFCVEFAHAAIDHGATAYVGHGYTSLGIEIYRGCPIFYDIGMFGFQADSQTRHPSDAYDRWGLDANATPHELVSARRPDGRGPADAVLDVLHVMSEAFGCSYLADWTTTSARTTSKIVLHPVAHSGPDLPAHQRGVPLAAGPDQVERTLARLQAASASFGTALRAQDGKIFVDV